MTNTEHSSEVPSSARGLLTMLYALFGTKGGGALAGEPGLFGWVARRVALIVALGSVGVLFLVQASAWALVTHEYLPAVSAEISKGVPASGPKGEPVPAPGPFGYVAALAVASGELYVEDSAAGYRLDRFTASTGIFSAQFPPSPLFPAPATGVAVEQGTGEVYAGAYGSGVGVFDAAGSLQAVWSGADTPSKRFGCFDCGSAEDLLAADDSVAVGDWAAGDVYVADPQHKVVDVFAPEASGGEKYVTQLTGISQTEPFSSGPTAVAVSEFNGDVIVRADGVELFKPGPVAGQYEFVGTLTPPGGLTHPYLAVDGTTGEIYASDEDHVDEFSAAGSYLGQFALEKGSSYIDPVAVDPSTHYVYVGREEGAVEVYGPDIVLPDVTTGAASMVKPFDAMLNGTVNPAEGGEATCRFAWGTTRALGNLAACEPESVSNGNTSVPVHAVLSGLAPDTTYYYRLQATNKADGHTNPGEASEDQEFTTPGPGFREESVSSVTSGSATLNATLNANNGSTSYYFEYSASDTSDCRANPALCTDSPSAPGEPIGSGAANVEVVHHLQGLSANTVYHYRVIALSEFEGESVVVEGPDQTFTTQSTGRSLVLPDGRGWELVSQPNKLGAQLLSIDGEVSLQASAAGGAIAYDATAPTEPEPPGSFLFGVHVLSVRGVSGWGSRDLAIPHVLATTTAGLDPEYPYFSEDLSSAILQPVGPFDPRLSNEASEQTAYVQSDFTKGNTGATCVSGCFRPLVTGAEGFANVPEGTEFGLCFQFFSECPGPHCPPSPFCGPQFRAASPDLSHIVLMSTVGLTRGSHGAGLYEWTGGHLTFVGNGVIGGTSTRGGDEFEIAVRHAISTDGSRVVLRGGLEGAKGLLLRDTVSGETVQLGGVGADFQTASADDSKIFFVEGGNLDECEIVEVAGRMQCGSTGAPATPAPVVLTPGAGVMAPIAGASEDGSTVYFVSNGILTGSARNSQGEAAVAGDCQGGSQPPPGEMCNLYVSHDDSGTWTTRLVAVLSGADSPDWGSDEDLSSAERPGGALRGLTARVSPDGRWLAFMSERSLTGYDNEDVTGSGRLDEEVYLYDADTGKLACASCDPTGARPHGIEYTSLNRGPAGGTDVWGESQWIAANIPGWSTVFYQSRYLQDGGRLFFNSSDALVPQDTNGTEDVYEYEPPGGGAGSPTSDTCTTSSATYSPASEGCVGLISSGGSPEQSGFLDASESGDDVFFMTEARLSARDVGSSFDVYDARVGGGEPAIVKPVECQGDACQAPVNAPEDLTPGSLTFQGPGNPVSLASSPTSKHVTQKAVKCKKPKKLTRGKCIKPKPKRKPKARKSARRNRRAQS